MSKRFLIFACVCLLAAIPLIAVNVDVNIAASADDATESAGSTTINGSNFTVDNFGEWFGFRFTGITITSGSTCNTAYLRLNYASGALDEPDVTIYGEDTTTPAQFSAAGNPNSNISSRTHTTASVDYGSADLGAPGQFNTSDLCTIVQELMDTYTYSSGVMAFLVTSRADDANRDMNVSLWDDATAPEPEFHMTYTEPSGATVILRRRVIQ